MTKIRKDPKEGVVATGIERSRHIQELEVRTLWLDVDIGGEGEGASKMTTRFPPGYWVDDKAISQDRNTLGKNRFGPGEVSGFSLRDVQ